MNTGDQRDGNEAKPLFPPGQEPEKTMELVGTEEWLTTEIVGPEQLGKDWS